MLSCMSSLYFLDISPLSDVSLVNIFYSVGCLLILLSFLHCAKPFQFDVVPFVSLEWGDMSEKILLNAMSESLLPVFSPRSFMVSGLTCKHITHFEFILVRGIRKRSSVIFLSVSVQLPQPSYWRDCLHAIAYSCLFCSRLHDRIGVGLFWAPYSAPLIHVSVSARTALFWWRAL